MKNGVLTGEQRRSIVAKLLSLTERQMVKWSVDTGPIFSATVGGGMVYQIESIDRDDFHPYLMTIAPEGNKWEFPVLIHSDDLAPEDASKMGELYELIRLQVYGWDEMRAEIFESLEDVNNDPFL